MEVGINETKEVLVACVKVGKLVMEVLQDGAQTSDLLLVVKELLTNGEIRGDLMAAVKGITEVPAELKDLSMEEALELVDTLVGLLVKK